MWLALLHLMEAEAVASSWQAWSPIIVAVVALLSAVGAAFLAMKGTFRTSDTQRESAFEAAVDRDRQQLRDERDKLQSTVASLTTELFTCREKYARLRIAAITHGLDPDNLTGGGGASAP